ncbi:hypothetical protein WMY93_021969 [Mugilogobius chulae]|uniref:DH domain-containing protein n=1 Tax=Mugilogobius chulae TaxID=88201 RepID=A0AAW0NM71_9GOBI
MQRGTSLKTRPIRNERVEVWRMERSKLEERLFQTIPHTITTCADQTGQPRGNNGTCSKVTHTGTSVVLTTVTNFYLKLLSVILWKCAPLCTFKSTEVFVHLPEHDLGEDDIYDCVPCDDDGDDIYEDIIKVEVRQPMIRYMQKMGMTEEDKRNCCLVEIQETEAKYYKTLEEIEKNYMIPLKQVLTPQEMDAIFVNLEECTMKVQEGKFKLQDLLVVPMQRVLKYHLLLKVPHTTPLTHFNFDQG